MRSEERRGGEGTPGGISSILYQRPGARQKLREALVDLRIWPNPREGLVKKLGGTFAALLQMLSRREIKPLAGTSKLAIIDHLVRVLRKARYTLSADVKQHKEYVGAGRPGRFVLSKDLKP